MNTDRVYVVLGRARKNVIRTWMMVHVQLCWRIVIMNDKDQLIAELREALSSSYMKAYDEGFKAAFKVMAGAKRIGVR